MYFFLHLPCPEQAISKFAYASISKRVFVQNLLDEMSLICMKMNL